MTFIKIIIQQEKYKYYTAMTFIKINIQQEKYSHDIH